MSQPTFATRLQAIKQDVTTNAVVAQLRSKAEFDAWASIVRELLEPAGLTSEAVAAAYLERVRFYLAEGYVRATAAATPEVKGKLARRYAEKEPGEFPVDEPAPLFD